MDVIKFINFWKTLSILKCNFRAKYYYYFFPESTLKNMDVTKSHIPHGFIYNIFDISPFLAYLLSKDFKKRSLQFMVLYFFHFASIQVLSPASLYYKKKE